VAIVFTFLQHRCIVSFLMTPGKHYISCILQNYLLALVTLVMETV